MRHGSVSSRGEREREGSILGLDVECGGEGAGEVFWAAVAA